MPFKTGQKKLPNSGIKKGEKQKKTLILDNFAKDIVDGGMEKFRTELNKLTGQNYVYAYLSIFEYVKPKLSRTTIEGDGNNPLVIEESIDISKLSELAKREIAALYNSKGTARLSEE